MFRRIRILHLVFALQFERHDHVLSRRVEQRAVERGLRIQYRMGAYRGDFSLIDQDKMCIRDRSQTVKMQIAVHGL